MIPCFDLHRYGRLIGELNLVTMTRPGIVFGMSVVSQFLSSPLSWPLGCSHRNPKLSNETSRKMPHLWIYGKCSNCWVFWLWLDRVIKW